MTRRDISLTIALCASLVLHALIVGSTAEFYTRNSVGHIWLPGFGPRETLPTLLVELPQPKLDPMQRLGGEDRGGEAVDPSAGDVPMISPQKTSQGQAFMSLDPEGPGKIGDDPSDSVLPVGKPMNAAAMASPPSPPQPQDELSAPFGLASTGGDFIRRTIPQPPPAPPMPPAPPSADTTGTPGAPTAADPAPLGDSESDPTTTVGGAEFRRGYTQVRLGRKHKITRPHLSIAAYSELMTKALPTVVLKLKIDETGKVISADIYRSSGSTDVDQPCKLAAYNWWFEPLKDKAGKPSSDVILFTIRFL
jgi:TonB family protein